MVKRIDTIILLVSDIGQSVSFYKDVIGIPLKFKSPGWAEFVIGSVHLALHRKGETLMQKSEALAAIGVSVNFEVENLDRMVTKLRSFNVEPVGGVKSYEFGRYMFVTDPDGYIVGFREYTSESVPQFHSQS
jgi:lactoylglutathione lyase